MMRSSMLVVSVAALTAVTIGSLIFAGEKAEKEVKGEKADSESVDTFLKSLEGDATPESDRCPGETPADREVEPKPEEPAQRDDT